ncbi:MAG: Copper(I)-binding protein [Frankiales bacterium]|nr:Copper(I)-binding protein [Frankiales bacterium]
MRSRSTAPLVTALLVTGLLMAGCGTGLQATTYTKETSPRDFNGTSIANLEVRNLGIAAPASGLTFKAGDSAVLTGSVVNTGTTDDALVAVESVAATSVTLSDGTATAAPTVPIPAGSDASSWSATLTGLTADLRAGQYVTVTLVFERAGRLTGLQVPVRSGDNGLEGRTPEQDPYGGTE